MPAIYGLILFSIFNLLILVLPYYFFTSSILWVTELIIILLLFLRLPELARPYWFPGIITVSTGLFSLLFLAGNKRKVDILKCKLTNQEQDWQKGQTRLETVKTEFYQREKEIRNWLNLYEITRRVSITLTTDKMMEECIRSFQDYLAVKDFVFFIVTETGELNLLLRKGLAPQNWDKEQVAQIKDKVVADTRNSLLYIPLKGLDRLMGVAICRFPAQLAPAQIDELVNISGLVVEQLSLGLGKAYLYDQVEKKSKIDGLTGLYRRHNFLDRLAEEVQRAMHYRLTFAVGMSDIDYFKKCNDTYGHQVGDEILRTTARLIKENLYETDTLGRYGGEEFIFLLRNSEPSGTHRKINNIRELIANHQFNIGWEQIKVTVSFGLSFFPYDGTTVEQLIKCADTALYYSKEKGRNRVTNFQEIKSI